jgi:hypothetical protein
MIGESREAMDKVSRVSADLAAHIAAVKNKRARFVLDAIAKKGMVTTEEINQAGYEHPPRAVRDARELGFPIRTIKVKHSNGRAIAAYIFPENARFGRGKSGRRSPTKKQRDAIIDTAGEKCQICAVTENLQVDHRVPYEVAGETDGDKTAMFMVLCGSCNRKKSWSCEHCPNWSHERSVSVCESCYWSGLAEYTHVATEQQRRADLVWRLDEIADYERLREKASQAAQAVPEYIKRLLRSG